MPAITYPYATAQGYSIAVQYRQYNRGTISLPQEQIPFVCVPSPNETGLLIPLQELVDGVTYGTALAYLTSQATGQGDDTSPFATRAPYSGIIPASTFSSTRYFSDALHFAGSKTYASHRSLTAVAPGGVYELGNTCEILNSYPHSSFKEMSSIDYDARRRKFYTTGTTPTSPYFEKLFEFDPGAGTYTERASYTLPTGAAGQYASSEVSFSAAYDAIYWIITDNENSVRLLILDPDSYATRSNTLISTLGGLPSGRERGRFFAAVDGTRGIYLADSLYEINLSTFALTPIFAFTADADTPLNYSALWTLVRQSPTKNVVCAAGGRGQWVYRITTPYDLVQPDGSGSSSGGGDEEHECYSRHADCAGTAYGRRGVPGGAFARRPCSCCSDCDEVAIS